MNPLVTVVIPSFNQAQYLDQTIRSVLEQDYRPIEVMVVDGGSTDGSVEIIRRHASSLAWWASEKDQGQADAINKGWSRATGDVVTFLNSDDYYYPGTLRTIVDTFERNQDAGLVYGMADFISSDGVRVSTTQHGELDGQRFLDKMSGLPQPATFMRRKVIDKVGILDSSFHFALDGEFFTRVVGNFRAVRIPKVLATMRLHPASKSVSAGKGFAPEVLRVAEKVIAHPELYPRYRVEPRRVRAAAHLVAARFELVSGDFMGVARSLLSSARQSPAYWPKAIGGVIPRAVARAVLGKERYLQIGARLGQRAPR